MNIPESNNARKAIVAIALVSFPFMGCDNGGNKLPDQSVKDQAAEIARKDAEAYESRRKEMESMGASDFEAAK